MGKRILLTVMVMIVGGLTALYFLVQPTRQLDLAYTKVPWGERVREAVLNLGVLSLTEADLSNLVKEQISARGAAKQLPITGAAVELDNDQAIGYLNLQRGPIPIGIEVRGTVALANDTLVFTPTEYQIGRIPVSVDLFNRITRSLHIKRQGSVRWDLKPFLPREAGIKSIVVQKKHLNIVLSAKRLLP